MFECRMCKYTQWFGPEEAKSVPFLACTPLEHREIAVKSESMIKKAAHQQLSLEMHCTVEPLGSCCILLLQHEVNALHPSKLFRRCAPMACKQMWPLMLWHSKHAAEAVLEAKLPKCWKTCGRKSRGLRRPQDSAQGSEEVRPWLLDMFKDLKHQTAFLKFFFFFFLLKLHPNFFLQSFEDVVGKSV